MAPLEIYLQPLQIEQRMNGLYSCMRHVNCPQDIHLVVLCVLIQNYLFVTQDILYQFPKSESASKLVSLRGMFLTLSDLMSSVTGSSANR